MPALFLGVGAMFNLNKWIYFYMRILAFTKIGKGIHEFANNDVRLTVEVTDDDEITSGQDSSVSADDSR